MLAIITTCYYIIIAKIEINKLAIPAQAGFRVSCQKACLLLLF